jgi:hypothetical protein
MVFPCDCDFGFMLRNSDNTTRFLFCLQFKDQTGCSFLNFNSTNLDAQMLTYHYWIQQTVMDPTQTLASFISNMTAGSRIAMRCAVFQHTTTPSHLMFAIFDTYSIQYSPFIHEFLQAQSWARALLFSLHNPTDSPQNKHHSSGRKAVPMSLLL